MSDTHLTKVLLEEFRELRKEINTNFDGVYKRLNNIELAHAEEKGIKKATAKHAGWLAILISSLGTGILNLAIYIFGKGGGNGGLP